MVAGVALAACHRDALPVATLACCDKTAALKSEDSVSEMADASTVEASAVSELAPGPRFRREEGCARDLKSSASASRDIDELRRLCAQGMAPLSTPVVVTAAGGIAEAPFRLNVSGACLRAAAVAASGAVSLALVGPSGEILASASSAEPLVVTPADGTVCVREPGAYRAVVRFLSQPNEGSSVTIQVWQAKKEE
jgi:hypothetical protein